jgi:hypothetical protein
MLNPGLVFVTAAILLMARSARSTLTVNEQAEEFPARSLALQFTVVEPKGKSEPEGGRQLTAPPEHFSVNVGGE